MIGKIVRMKKNNAKWYLDHPEIYFYDYDSKCDPSYKVETLIHLMCCFDIPVVGKVTGTGSDCWKVKWKVSNLVTEYLIDRKYFEIMEE